MRGAAVGRTESAPSPEVPLAIGPWDFSVSSGSYFMRRIVLSVMVAGSAAALAACGGGGTAFGSGSNSIDRVVVTGSGSLSGVNKVVPGGTIVLSATGVKGSSNTTAGDNGYSWSASYAPVGTPAQALATGSQIFCNGLTTPAISPAGSLNVSSVNPSTLTLVVPTAVPAVTAPAASIAPAAPAGSYCLIVQATHTADGKFGTAVVVVDNTP